MGKKGGKLLTVDQRCFIALGSNVTHKKLTLGQLLVEALDALQNEGLVIRARSRDFATPAFPAGSGPDFVNAVAEVASPFDALETLAVLHRVGALFDRTREVRWGARALGLDMIAYGDLVLPDAQTHQYWRELPLEAQVSTAPTQAIVPHPRLAERAFVLVPLMDIAPDWRHPVTGKSVKQMRDALPTDLLNEVVGL